MLDRIVSAADAGRIDKADRHALYGNPFFDDVARRARHVGDDGSFCFQKTVEQTRLSGVRRAGDGRHDAVPHHTAAFGLGQHIVQTPLHVPNSAGNIGHLYFFQVFFGIIDSHFQPRNEISQMKPHIAYNPGQAAFELADGAGQALGALGLNDVHDGLGLSQVEAAVDKGPLGKFAGIGQPRAVAQDQPQDFTQGLAAAVALYFQDILCRIRTGTLHDEKNNFVHRFAVVVYDQAVLYGPIAPLR